MSTKPLDIRNKMTPLQATETAMALAGRKPKAFDLPPLAFDAADLETLHQLAENDFLESGVAVKSAEDSLASAKYRQKAAYELIEWIENKMVEHHDRVGKPIKIRLYSFEQDPSDSEGA